MRIFTAIPVPKPAQDAFLAASKGKLPIPYVNAGNLHVTLNFLGELDTDRAAQVQQTWTESLPSMKPFQIEPDVLDKFGNLLVLRVKPSEPLMTMQATMRAHFEKMGFMFDQRPYAPHISLGQMHLDNVMFRSRKVADFPNDLLTAMSFEADRIILYESKLLLHHPKYIPLSTHELK